MCPTNDFIPRKRLRIEDFVQSFGPFIAAALHHFLTMLFPVLRVGVAALPHVDCGSTAGITAGTTVGAATHAEVGDWVARRAWTGASGGGVEVVGAKCVRGVEDPVLVYLVMEVVNVVLQRSVRVRLTLYES